MKVFDAVLLTIAFLFNSVVLGVDWEYIGVAFGGSFSGAMILAYFRRDPRKAEQAFKVLCSSISGLVFGTVIQEYWQLMNPKYVLALFFVSSMLSLVFLRALLSLTEQNAADICKNAIQRLLNLQLKDEQDRRRQKGRQRRRPSDEGRHITFEDTIPPENKE